MFKWSRKPLITAKEKIEQAEQAKAYQDRIKNHQSDLYNEYYRALERGYIPNITKYTT